MKIWSQYLTNILYFHHRIIGAVIIALGACVALWIVYVFIFTTAPAQPIQEEVNDVPIQKEALERVMMWNNDKQDHDAASGIVPNNSFATPPVLR